MVLLIKITNFDIFGQRGTFEGPVDLTGEDITPLSPPSLQGYAPAATLANA